MLANWNGAPLHLPDFQFHEKHRAVIKTNYPEKIMPLIKAFNLEKFSHPGIDVDTTVAPEVARQGA